MQHFSRLHGLKTLQTSTNQNTSDESKQSSHTVQSEGDADFSILGKGITVKLNYIYNHISTTSTTNLYSDVETKVMHDNSFRQVIEHLEKNNLIDTSANRIGQFIKISGEFHLLYLEYYQKLFTEPDFIKMMDEPKTTRKCPFYQHFRGSVVKGQSPLFSKGQNRVFSLPFSAPIFSLLFSRRFPDDNLCYFFLIIPLICPVYKVSSTFPEISLNMKRTT